MPMLLVTHDMNISRIYISCNGTFSLNNQMVHMPQRQLRLLNCNREREHVAYVTVKWIVVGVTLKINTIIKDLKLRLSIIGMAYINKTI